MARIYIVLLFVWSSNMCRWFCFQEKQLQVNMKINKLRETVKAQQEKVTKHGAF